MGRFIHFAMAAAQEAMRHSGLQVTPEIAENVGVHIGSGIGGFDVIEREHTALMNGGPRKISPFFIPATIINLAAGHVSIKYGAKGPNEATATACTSSAHSIGDAFRIIQRGDADAMIAGGAEAAITPLSVGGFAAMKALSTRNDDPTHACRPFDKDRDGFVCGEGAGILILEELSFAQAPRRPHPRRDHRLRHERRRLPHDRHGPGRRWLPPRHGGRSARRRYHAGQDRLRQRPRHLHCRRRRPGVAGHRKRLRRKGQEPRASGQFHQVHDRPPSGRSRRLGSRHHHHGHAKPDRSAHHEPRERGPGLPPRTTSPTSRKPQRSTTPSPTASASAAPTARWSSNAGARSKLPADQSFVNRKKVRHAPDLFHSRRIQASSRRTHQENAPWHI